MLDKKEGQKTNIACRVKSKNAKQKQKWNY
jgi:hypothetical protein